MIEHKFPYESFIGGWYISNSVCDDMIKVFYSSKLKKETIKGLQGKNGIPDINLNIKDSEDLIISHLDNDKEILNAEVKKLKNLDFYNVKFLKKTATTLLYERTLNVDGKKNASKNVGIEHKSYHLFMTKTIQNIIYTFETNDGGSTKEIIELQEKCINSIHEINNSKNS